MLSFKGAEYSSILRKSQKHGSFTYRKKTSDFEYTEIGFFKKTGYLAINGENTLFLDSSGKGNCSFEGKTSSFEIKRQLFKDDLTTVVLDGESFSFSTVNFFKNSSGEKYALIKGLGCIKIADKDIFFSSFFFLRSNEKLVNGSAVEMEMIPFFLLALLKIDISE